MILVLVGKLIKFDPRAQVKRDLEFKDARNQDARNQEFYQHFLVTNLMFRNTILSFRYSVPLQSCLFFS